LVRAQVGKGRGGPSIFTPEAVFAHDSREGVADLMAAGALQSQIGRTFDLDAAAAALRHVEEEHARARVVVSASREG
jgi:NADPH:quinone reductase-like Zn-dependent oxidoreductase